MQFERWFRLSGEPGSGVSCDEKGLFVGATPLLERTAGPDGRAEWRPRPWTGLNCDLGKAYSLPVDFGEKTGGLASVGRALDRGEIVLAQIAALLLQIPDPPALMKSEHDGSEVPGPALALQAGGLLRDPAAERREKAQANSSIGPKKAGSLWRLGKYNHNHDERGRFTTAEGAVEPDGAGSKRPKGIQVAFDVESKTKGNDDAAAIA